MPHPRAFGIRVGTLPTGASNSICDVAGVSVGHVTLSEGAVQTGVSVIHTGSAHPFEQKCVAGHHVFNGFGKSVGLVQLEELGQLETPIVLTNTLSVGTASTALVRHMLALSPAIGETTGTVNPLVMECNDGGWLNDIRGLHVSEDHVAEALAQKVTDCPSGAIGAGTGMSCYGLKGGIGSASRAVSIGGQDYMLGVLTLCNMGLAGDLIIDGRHIGPALTQALASETDAKRDELGSIIIVVATDAPLSSRQLKRLSKRACAGLARTGTQFGNGSGDIALSFSTANRMPHDAPDDALMTRSQLHEDKLDMLFRASIEATEEAILDCLFSAKTMTGKHGRVRMGLADIWDKIGSR